VIGPALNENIAGPENDFILVEQHRHFAEQDNRIVDRLGPVHHRVPAILRKGRGTLIAESGKRTPRIIGAHRADGGRLRREVVDAQNRASALRELPP